MKQMLTGKLIAAAFVVIWTTAPWAQTAEGERVREAATVFEEIMSAPDKAIPKAVLDKAEAIAVFPSMIRAGFVIGGQHGRGILSVRDRKAGGWSAPAFLTITGGSIGAQIGGQAIDLVLLIMNRRGVEHLMRNEFKVGGEASAAAGPVGRAAEVSTDIQLRAEILSYSRSRGLFAGVSLNGSSIREDADANEHLYGKRYHSREIALDGLGGAPPAIGVWRDMLAKYVR